MDSRQIDLLYLIREKEPDANGTNGWGTGAIDRNTFLKSKYGSGCIKSTAYGAQVFTYIN